MKEINTSLGLGWEELLEFFERGELAPEYEIQLYLGEYVPGVELN